MYTITHDGRTLFDPAAGEQYIEAPILSREVNKLASLEFTIYPGHAEFTQIKPHTSRIAVYEDGNLVIIMRPVYKKNLFTGGVTWKCEELAAKLDDVLHRPDIYTGTVTNYITHMIHLCNQLSDTSIMRVGNILFNASTEDTFVNDEYEGFWEGLVEHLVDVYGGYLIPRYTNSKVYIDYVTDSDLAAGGQVIQFGENMADLFLETESEEMFTVLIPLGADEDVTNPQPEQARTRPMTIASVNDGKDYLENADGIALYGRREKIQEWKSISDATELKTKGQSHLSDHSAQLKETITLSAIDLHYLNVSTPSIAWMTRVSLYSAVHSINAQYTATKLDTHLGNPEPISLQLGKPEEVMTDRLPKNNVSKRRGGGGGGGGGGGRALGEDDINAHIKVERDRISLLVEGDGGAAKVKAASIVAAINGSESSVYIDADKVYINGSTTIKSLLTGGATATSIKTTALSFGGHDVAWANITYVAIAEVTLPSLTRSGTYSFRYGTGESATGTVSGSLVTNYTAGSVNIVPQTRWFAVQSTA